MLMNLLDSCKILLLQLLTFNCLENNDLTKTQMLMLKLWVKIQFFSVIMLILQSQLVY